MLKLLLTLVLVGLGHSATAKHIVLPSGDQGYSIRCDNEPVNACYEMAGSVCHRGYAIYDRNTQIGAESSSFGYVGPGLTGTSILGTAGSSSQTTSEKGLLIQCKEPELTEIENLKREKDAAERAKAEDRAYEARSRTAALIVVGAAIVIVLAVVFTAHH